MAALQIQFGAYAKHSAQLWATNKFRNVFASAVSSHLSFPSFLLSSRVVRVRALHKCSRINAFFTRCPNHTYIFHSGISMIGWWQASSRFFLDTLRLRRKMLASKIFNWIQLHVLNFTTQTMESHRAVVQRNAGRKQLKWCGHSSADRLGI